MIYKQVDEEGYEAAVEDGLETFQNLIAAYFGGLITLSVLRARFQEGLEIHYTRLMSLGLGGREPTQRDIEFLQIKTRQQSDLLEVFMADLARGKMTENRALWRAGMYAPKREIYIAFTVPSAVAGLMEGLPGDICLGNGLCGCHLEVSFDSSGNAVVDWIVDQDKESCEVCLDMQARSPFNFTREQIEAYG